MVPGGAWAGSCPFPGHSHVPIPCPVPTGGFPDEISYKFCPFPPQTLSLSRPPR